MSQSFYELIENKSHYSILLNESQVQYHYSIVRVNEDEQLSYSVAIEDNPNGVDTSSDKINQLMGIVLLELLEKGAVDNGNG